MDQLDIVGIEQQKMTNHGISYLCVWENVLKPLKTLDSSQAKGEI